MRSFGFFDGRGPAWGPGGPSTGGPVGGPSSGGLVDPPGGLRAWWTLPWGPGGLSWGPGGLVDPPLGARCTLLGACGPGAPSPGGLVDSPGGRRGERERGRGHQKTKESKWKLQFSLGFLQLCRNLVLLFCFFKTPLHPSLDEKNTSLTQRKTSKNLRKTMIL